MLNPIKLVNKNFLSSLDMSSEEVIHILELAKKIETPAYIYSKKKIIENVNTLKSGLKKVDGLICFSVKANSNLNLLKVLVSEGLGMDIVSGGELRKALLAGCNSKKIVFSGVGKSPIDIEYAIREDICQQSVAAWVTRVRPNAVRAPSSRLRDASLFHRAVRCLRADVRAVAGIGRLGAWLNKLPAAAFAARCVGRQSPRLLLEMPTFSCVASLPI